MASYKKLKMQLETDNLKTMQLVFAIAFIEYTCSIDKNDNQYLFH